MRLSEDVLRYRRCPACGSRLPRYVRFVPGLARCACQGGGVDLTGPVFWLGAVPLAAGMALTGRALDKLGLRARWFDRLAEKLAMSGLRKGRP